jgi:hypothetical protein
VDDPISMTKSVLVIPQIIVQEHVQEFVNCTITNENIDTNTKWLNRRNTNTKGHEKNW